MSRLNEPDYLVRCIDFISTPGTRWIADVTLITLIVGTLWLGHSLPRTSTELSTAALTENIYASAVLIEDACEPQMKRPCCREGSRTGGLRTATAPIVGHAVPWTFHS
jgi:hypothetical protein